MKLHKVWATFIVLFLLSTEFAYAQENMMAQSNKSISLSYGLYNYYRTGINKTLKNAAMQFGENSSANYTYKVAMTNPFTLTYDYAYRDNTGLGLSASYFSYAMTENRTDQIDNLTTTLKGFYASIAMRGVRYVRHNENFILYIFGGVGLKIRSQSSNADLEYQKKASYLFQSQLTTLKGFSPLYWEAGCGMKFAVSKSLGLMVEFTRAPGWANFGIFYRMVHKSRKSTDKLGW